MFDLNAYDKYQIQAIKTLNNCLLIAGAGAGKTYTIVGKINYLISNLIYLPQEILVISFTNKSVDDLKRKIKEPIDIFTFHKLAMQILTDHHIDFKIASDNYLEYIINEFFLNLEVNSLKKEIVNYFKVPSYTLFLKSIKYQNLIKTISTFIHLYKTSLGDKNIFASIASKHRLYTKLIMIIFNIYQKELISSNTFDFDDLITQATQAINKFYKYKLIIIDEFQDTSYLRFQLVQKLLTVNKAKLFAVGDDYQSIYHFSGCNINLFLNIQKYIPNTEVLKLKYTYRNSQELIDCAGKFILRNPKQITKNLISKSHINRPIIIKYYFHKTNILTNVLEKLITKYQDILVLERNNQDIIPFLNSKLKLEDNYLFYKEHKIRLLTVHSAKGLEADCVILINLENTVLGFPSQIKDNPLTKDLNNLEDNFLDAEERRLFYVALTRTKNEIYLLTPLFKSSIFVKEIKKYLP